MNRREFITLLGGAAVAWPVAARAQQRDPVKRLGVLWGLAENDNVYEPYLSAFKQRLQDLGWIDGRNVRVEYRFTGGVTERNPHRGSGTGCARAGCDFSRQPIQQLRLYCRRRGPFRLSLRSSPIRSEAVSF